ncbi:signal-induced proliferation-associated 1-like protein 2 [Aplochiton taeniatus]
MQTQKMQPLQATQGSAAAPPAKPKMGVRVSHWPHRNWEAQPPPRYDSLEPSFASPPGVKGQEAELGAGRVTFAPLCDLLLGAPMKGSLVRLKRSTSEVTVSDMGDPDDAMEGTLCRRYGSTSSLDRQSFQAPPPPQSFQAPPFTAAGQPSAPPTPQSYLTPPPPQSFQAPPPPQSFPELLRLNTSLSPSLQTAAQIARGDILRIPGYSDYVDCSMLYGREREPSLAQRMKASGKAETSLFRRLRSGKSVEGECLGGAGRGAGRGQRGFCHHDVQSVLFSFSQAEAGRCQPGRQHNTSTGASAASQGQGSGPCWDSPVGSSEDLGFRANTEADDGDGRSNNLLLSCPFFRNELGGEGDRRLGHSAPYMSGGEGAPSGRCPNASVSVLEGPRDSQGFPVDGMKRSMVEHVDLGAYYYQKYFYNKDHQNYFGSDENLGSVAVSIRREKLEEGKDGTQYNYRVVFRTSELTTLRGAILEDAVPSTSKHGTVRGLPLKEVLEYVVPELNVQCLRLATNSPKVPEQLLRLDQQGLSVQHKVGLLLCGSGQGSEEEMYNNKDSSPALEELMGLLGQTVRLHGFTKYKAQLDTQTDSTGTHSLYTTYKDYELMFHVSTLLPYTHNNRQQLLRKRHIGNDIVTIIFQEPGALPFTPQTIRSHFQHVFLIVRVHNPCTDNTCYSVGVTRSKDVPAFGPPIPQGVLFPKSAVFRDFLLAKIINAENAAHKSDKFGAMAMRTRQEYLTDLAQNHASSTPLDSASNAKFSFITLGAKRKERTRPRRSAHLESSGAVTWSVLARDFSQSADVGCLLAVSNEFVVLIEERSREVVFNCYCRDVIGWAVGAGGIKLFYERGECLVFSAPERGCEDLREIAQRLERVSRGGEALEMGLRRNALGQLGFHVNSEGVVADVEAFGFAWQAGLRPGCRLVEICQVAVATLSHEQMIDLLRTSALVSVMVVHPHDDGTPRSRSYTELYRAPVVEYQVEPDGNAAPYRMTAAGWHRVSAVPGPGLCRMSPTQSPSEAPRMSPSQGPTMSPSQGPSPGQQMFHYVQGSISRSASFDRKPQDGTRVHQDYDLVQSVSGSRGEAGQFYCSSPSNQSTSSDPGPAGTWNQKMIYHGCQSPALLDPPCEKESEPLKEREPKLERTRSAEVKWLHPTTKVLNPREKSHPRPGQPARAEENQRQGETHRHSGMAPSSSHCSSPCSINTLSSNGSHGSSSSNGDKRYGSADPMEPEILGLHYIKGASTDSGIDTAPCMAPPAAPALLPDSRGQQWALEAGTPDGGLSQGCFTTQGTSAGNLTDGSLGDLSEISSLSSGSRRSRSPSERGLRTASSSADASKLYILSPGGSAPSCQSQAPDYGTGWQKTEDGLLLEESNHFRLRAGLSPDGHLQVQPVLDRDSFLGLMLADSQPGGVGVPGQTVMGVPGLRPLYRSVSDESLHHRRPPSLLSSSQSSLQDVPECPRGPPYHSTLPPPRAHLPLYRKRAKMADAGLMLLPESSSGMDWSHLVDAARAFAAERASLSSMSEAEHTQHALVLSQELSRRASSVDSSALQDGTACRTGKALQSHCSLSSNSTALQDGEPSPARLSGKVDQLEEILMRLQYDLRKEQRDKAELQEQVQSLRQDNLRLHQESQTAAAQLSQFTQWFLLHKKT